jgi:hypothetical protein
LVDANPFQHGLTICGKRIQAPDVILQNKSKVVVITALSRKDEIHASLRASYPCVEHVLIPGFEVNRDGIVPILRQI